jgi:hypothetical protein
MDRACNFDGLVSCTSVRRVEASDDVIEPGTLRSHSQEYTCSLKRNSSVYIDLPAATSSSEWRSFAEGCGGALCRAVTGDHPLLSRR